MITIPTMTIKILGFTLPQTKAAKGAASIPPINKPRVICQFPVPIIKINVPAPAAAIKNSARLTEPIVKRGVRPWPSKDVVTTGPYPPPPTASMKPPNKASGPTKRVFCLGFRLTSALRTITSPIPMR